MRGENEKEKKARLITFIFIQTMLIAAVKLNGWEGENKSHTYQQSVIGINLMFFMLMTFIDDAKILKIDYEDLLRFRPRVT